MNAEKSTSLSTGSLTQKTGVVVFARILTTIIDLAIVIATIRILSKTDFAIIGYLLMIHELVRNLATLGFPDSIFYFFGRLTGSGRRALTLQTGALLAGASVIAALLILGLNAALPSLLTQWDPKLVAQLGSLLPWIALVTVLEIPTWPTSNILLALDRQKDAAWYEMGTSLLTFIAVVGPLTLGFGVEFAVYGLVCYAAVRLLVSVIWVGVALPGRNDETEANGEPHSESQSTLPQTQRVSIRSQLTFSLPIGLSAYVNKLNRNVDKLIVSLLLPAAALAEYNLGAQEVPIIRVIPFAVGSVLISRYVSLQVQARKEELLALWHKGVEKVSLMVVPLTILAVLLAPDLIPWIASTENADYRAAILPFQIYNLIILIRVTHYGSILQAFGDSKGVLWMSLNLVAANILLSIPFTIWMGITGTALATLIANLYNWVVYLRRIGRHMEIPARKVLPFGYYLRVLWASCLAAGIAGALRWFAVPDLGEGTGLLLSLISFLLVFPVSGHLFGAIRTHDWKDLRDWLSLKFLRSNG